MDGLKSLLKSRKFWLAVFGLFQSLVLHFFDVPETVWLAVDGLVMVLINSIAKEDAALKSSGRSNGS